MQTTMTRDEFRQLAANLAASIPGGWTVTENDYRPSDFSVNLTDRDGISFGLEMGSYSTPAGKMHVSGNTNGLSKYRRYQEQEGKSINVDPHRGIVAVANDIARRFLPSHRALMAHLQASEAADKAYKARARATADSILEASGGLLREGNNNGDGDGSQIVLCDNTERNAGLSLRLDVSGSDSINIRHGWMSVNFAVKLAELIAQEYDAAA